MKDAPLTLTPLPYAFDALSPALSDMQVRWHHQRNQATYVREANRLLAETGGDWGLAPSATYEKYRFNRDGAILHEMYWNTYTPGGSPSSRQVWDLLGGDLPSLRRDLVSAAMDVQGSGWAFLSVDTLAGEPGTHAVHSIPNHDYPWDEHLQPAIVIDVWEHAYAVDYWNDRRVYVERLLNLINWPVVEHRIRNPGAM